MSEAAWIAREHELAFKPQAIFCGCTVRCYVGPVWTSRRQVYLAHIISDDELLPILFFDLGDG